MAIFDKFLNSVRLVEDEDYEDEYDEYEDDYEEEAPRKRFFGFGRKKYSEDEEVEEESVRGKLTPMRGGRSTSSRMEVCVIRPSAFEDVKEIADTLLSNRVVILNMEGVDLALAQRIIDFMTGSCYAIDGNIRKISNFIFILTPAAVNISGDLQGLVDAFEATGSLSSMGSTANTMKAVGGISGY